MTREDAMQAARALGHAPEIQEPEFLYHGALECTRRGCNMGASYAPDAIEGAAVTFTCPGRENADT